MSAMPKKTFSTLPSKTACGMRIALAFFLAFVVKTGWAQPQDAGEFQRASTTQRLSEFPKVAKDGRVWFQFKAPNAQKVQFEHCSHHPMNSGPDRIPNPASSVGAGFPQPEIRITFGYNRNQA